MTKYPITVGDLLEFLKELDPDMPVCCQRYSDMGFQEMPRVVSHPTYVERYDRWGCDEKSDILPLHAKVYLLFEGN